MWCMSTAGLCTSKGMSYLVAGGSSCCPEQDEPSSRQPRPPLQPHLQAFLHQLGLYSEAKYFGTKRFAGKFCILLLQSSAWYIAVSSPTYRVTGQCISRVWWFPTLLGREKHKLTRERETTEMTRRKGRLVVNSC